jgi:deoxyribodipyrimidine photo-lyase
VTTSILWFRRDLRLSDHPALLAAAAEGADVVPVFVLDPQLLRHAGPNRVAFLLGALDDLRARTGGALRVVSGDPVEVIPRLAQRTGAGSVHVSSDHGPYGRERDAVVDVRVRLTPTGSPYGVSPGRLRKADGTAYRVFTPYLRAWQAHGVRRPPAAPADVRWSDGGVPTEALPAAPDHVPLPEPTEAAALARWEEFRSTALPDYDSGRERPGTDGTSRLSPYLRWGLVHPRTLHAGLDAGPGARAFAAELVWRDFYADVLWHSPGSARWDLTGALTGLRYDEPGPLLDAWREGRTGYPFVDAGMRQLRAQGWMHNRVRMVVASFLTKDLHLHWTHGARHFLRHLVDGDLASNAHGWQWAAGTGTDAAPYFRVFNPVRQGLEHDPDGAYVRRWVPELAHLPGRAIHEPWTLERLPEGYPERVVDHATERAEALARYRETRGST